MRYSIQMRTWLATTCWRLMVALQLPRDDCCLRGCKTLEDLENVSEAQVNEKIMPAIADLDVPLVTSSRLKRIKAIREGARVSWDRGRRGAVEHENVPLPSKELKRSGSLFFSRYKLRSSADEDAGETVVRRLKRQLNKHCIGFENIMETKTRKGEAAETESDAQSLIMKPS